MANSTKNASAKNMTSCDKAKKQLKTRISSLPTCRAKARDAKVVLAPPSARKRAMQKLFWLHLPRESARCKRCAKSSTWFRELVMDENKRDSLHVAATTNITGIESVVGGVLPPPLFFASLLIRARYSRVKSLWEGL